MLIVLVFACVLLTAVLVSGMANRTILSTSVLFLVAGFMLGDGVLGVVTVSADDGMVSQLAELALFSVLFTDGMLSLSINCALRGGCRVERSCSASVDLGGDGGHCALLRWFAVGGVIPGRCLVVPNRSGLRRSHRRARGDPYRLRNLLNVESGLNDGLALPVAVVLLAFVGPDSIHAASLSGEVLAEIGIGIGIPFVAIRLERSRRFAATAAYEPLNAFAIGLLVLGVSSLNEASYSTWSRSWWSHRSSLTRQQTW